MRPAISVIIPAHNEERYIDACVTSLLHQNASFRYEIIVVENNSTDTTPQRLKAYPTIRLIRQKRKGASAARNRGARAAKGDILVFLDADCIASPDHLSRIVDFFATHPTVDVIGGPYIMHDGGRFVRWLTDQGDYYARYFQVTKLFFGYQAFAGGKIIL